MNKCSALILLACGFALLPTECVEAAPVTWDFTATSCSPPVVHIGLGGCDPTKASFPELLATLTLSGPDSSGSALLRFGNPVLQTGDSFDFELVSPGVAGHQFVSTTAPFGVEYGR